MSVGKPWRTIFIAQNLRPKQCSLTMYYLAFILHSLNEFSSRYPHKLSAICNDTRISLQMFFSQDF